MSEGQIDRIMDALIDIQKNQREFGERLAKVETLITERTNDNNEIRSMLKSHEERLTELESQKFTALGAKELLAFAIMAGIALYGALK